MRRLVLLTLVVSHSACGSCGASPDNNGVATNNGSTSVVTDPDEVGEEVAYEPPPPPDISKANLPRRQSGSHLLAINNVGFGLEFDATVRDPLTTAGSCSWWISSCFEPAQGRSLDDCFRSAPTCQSAEPWKEDEVCCPDACFDDYAKLRVDGEDAVSAVRTVLFQDGSCVPGLSGMTGGSP